MHEFGEYLSGQLAEHLRKRRVVVWYDPRGEFQPFIRELRGGAELLGCDVQPVEIAGLQTGLCVFAGSFFEVKFAVEPLFAADQPDPLLVYIAADRPAAVDDPLMELAQAGDCYQRQLKRLARNVLRRQYTDGVIDDMLAADGVGYEDIVGLLAGAGEGQASILKVIFPAATDTSALLSDWLATPASDAAIVEKGGKGELVKLIHSRLGLELAENVELAEARTRTTRHVLVGEFRDDLAGEPPTALAMIPTPTTREQVKAVRDLADTLRRRHARAYEELADRTEAELGLANQSIAPEALGKIDTFRFEERTLLRYVGQLLGQRKFDQASQVVADHHRCFWADRDLRRQQQWEACRLMAELGGLAAAIRKRLPAKGEPAADWVASYTAKDGWHVLDLVQRRLETLITTMSEDPESEAALNLVRAEYEKTLGAMATGFAEVLAQAHWSVPGQMNQTGVYPELVGAGGGPKAYFLVDSMRYEMGVELRDQLADAAELDLRPALAAVPTITPMGMAALLPGAATSFGVVAVEGRLAARVDGTDLAGQQDRSRFLKARVPGSVELELGGLLDAPTKRIKSKVEGATLVVVRSQDIDALGEGQTNRLARQVMDTAIGNIARAVRRLADLGIEQFVIAADHGHLFTWPRDDSMKIESPGGETVELHRRCWIGRGGTTPAGTVRVRGSELGYETDLDFVFPTGIGVFKAGGDLAYHHGGLSLQELVIPVLSVRMRRNQAAAQSKAEVQLGQVPEKVANRTFAVTLAVAGGLFGSELLEVRPILLRGGVQVGKAGMAMDAELNAVTGCVRLTPGKTATVAMLLQSEECEKIRVVVQDPATDAVLVQSDEIPVKLGM